MNRTLSAVVALALALPLCAQTPKPQTEDGSKVVAIINNEKITQAKLDQMYGRTSAQIRAEYEKNGGKAAFLDNGGPYEAKWELAPQADGTIEARCEWLDWDDKAKAPAARGFVARKFKPLRRAG